jgi:hypothetical protein
VHFCTKIYNLQTCRFHTRDTYFLEPEILRGCKPLTVIDAGIFFQILPRRKGDLICNPLKRVNETRDTVQKINLKKTNWIGHILHRNCLQKHFVVGNVEGRIEVTGIRGRKCKEPLDGPKEKRNFEEELLTGSLLRNRFGRGYGNVIRQTKE